MNLPTLAVRRPITTVMVLVSILVVGTIALGRLPLAFLPEVDVPFIAVSIPYPNSSPQQVEKDITKPVEEALATLPGVSKLSSTSEADGAEIELEFRWGEDLDVVRMLVSEKVEQVKAELPEGIGEPLIFSFNTTDIPVVQGRIAAQGVDLSKNYELLESRVLNRIRRVPGVARVDLNGVAPREIYIDLVLDRIKKHGVDIGPLVERLQGASSNLVLGEAQEGGLRYTARALGSFSSLEELGELEIDERGLRLADVAEISYEEPPIAFGRHLDGNYAIALEVFKESTANTVEVVHAVNRVIQEDIGADPLLQGIQLFVWQDQAEEITNGINGLRSAGLFGALLAVGVLYFFLRRLDSTLIVALTIPFSILAACGAMFFLGKSLNILSMMGLMLGVGMLVDNAIVVLESIDRRLAAGSAGGEHAALTAAEVRKQAALGGARQVALAVTAATLTSLIVFLPLIVGAHSELVTWLREVGITIALALVCSLFSSLTLIPLVAAHFLKPRKVNPGRLLPWLEERYAGALAWTLRHPAKTFGLVVLTLGVGLLPFFTGMVDASMFAARVNQRLFLDYEFQDFFYKSDAERAVNQIEASLDEVRERFGIESVYSYYAENEAGTVINLAEKGLVDEDVKKLRGEIREILPEIAGAKVSFFEDSDSGGDSTFFAVKLFGQDSSALAPLAAETERLLAGVGGVKDVSSSLKRGRQEIQVQIDREKASRVGLTADDLSEAFAFTLGGLRLPRFAAGDREVETWLSLRLEDRSNLDDLKALQIREFEGRPVLLGDVAHFEIVDRAKEIRRENRKARVAVQATYEGEDWEAVQEEIEARMNALNLPAGYSWSWNDRILEQQDQDQQMAQNFLLALLLVYLVMASLFESLAQPLAILLFSIFFALPGVAWMLALTGTPFNMMSQIGLLILLGIVVNNGIVLLDHVNHLRAEGMDREAAILQAGRDRLRPILMTAATTVIGLLPLALGGSGVGNLFYYPLARTVMGGLLSSAVLTLLVLPWVSLRFEAAADWLGSVWRTSAGRVRQPAPAAPSLGPRLETQG